MMNHHKYIFKLLIVLYIFFTQQLFPALLTDDFENNSTSGWNGSQGVQSVAGLPTQVLQLTHKAYNFKIYNFSSTLQNTPVRVQFDVYGTGKWNATDTIWIYDPQSGFQSFTFPTANGNTDPVAAHIDFNTTTDANGTLILYIYPAPQKNSHIAYLDNVSVDSGTDPAYPNFSAYYQKTFKGEMFTIGNTILVAPKEQEKNICTKYKNKAYISNANKSNDNYYLCAYYQDPNVTFPTTTATLSRPSPNAKVKWAGLYWQALVDKNYNFANMKVKIKHSALPNYTDVNAIPNTHFTLNQKQGAAGLPNYTSYAAFADITSYFVDNNLTSGTISVGNIPVIEGKIATLGTYGAWTLVVIYEDQNSSLKNFSVYNGWQKIDRYNTLVQIDLGGFHTPRNQPNVKASLSIFAAEGDRLIPGDALEVKPSKQPAFTTLLTNFDSTVDVNTTRVPAPLNNQGIDIRSFELGTAGKNIIASEETNMTLKLTSSGNYDANGNLVSQDAYWPSMVAFAVELYEPRICYDYAAFIGDVIPIKSDRSLRDLNTSTYSGTNVLPLKIQFLIHSYEADFVYEKSKAYISFTGTNAADIIHNHNYMEMSPAFKNSYYKYTDPHHEIEVNATLGQVALGENVIGIPNNNGGSLTRGATTYAILGYDINSSLSSISATFDLHFDAQITFSPGETPVNYSFSTATNNISLCDSNATYDPIHFGLTVERHAPAGFVPNTNNPYQFDYTYTGLSTQIVGRPYSIDIVSYTAGDIGAINQPTDINTTVELELINADYFQNSSAAGYDTTCQTPAAVGKGKLINLTKNRINRGRTPIVIPTDTNGSIDNDRAMHNAAFRLWVLTKKDANGNRSAILHDCNDSGNSNTCFETLYRNAIYIDSNQSHYCDDACINANKSNTACYTCMKDYYATAVCSWDNFSIRPDSFTMQLSDDNDYDTAVATPIPLRNNTQGGTQKVAAGYRYLFEINATQYRNTTKAYGYYSDRYLKYTYPLGTIPPDNNATGSIIIAEFNTTSPYNAAQIANCNDTGSTSLPYHFSDGSLTGTAHISLNNTGQYTLWMRDADWTEVDQAASIYKPAFGGVKVNDCTPGSSSDANTNRNSTGCLIASQKIGLITLDVKPYKFDVSGVKFIRRPQSVSTKKQYLFFNDLSNTTYYKNNNIGTQPTLMTAYFDGNVTAKSKTDQNLSNFTNNCASEDVTLKLYRTTSPYNESNLSTLYNTQLQQFLQYGSFTNPIADKKTGPDVNLTLPRIAFSDADKGSATIHLYTTFKKPLASPINPVTIQYNDLNATGSKSDSSADMGTHIPKGGNTYDNNITYVYGKVSPDYRLYDNVIENSKLTPISVDIYCDLLPSQCSTDYELTTPTSGHDEGANWYHATLFNNTDLGTSELKVLRIAEEPSNPSISVDAGTTPRTQVPFNDGTARQNDINISIPANNAKPTLIKVKYDPVPWLIYDPVNDYFRVHFVGPSSWAGVGEAGHVTDTASSREDAPRMNW